MSFTIKRSDYWVWVSGFNDLDAMTAGMQKSDLNYRAGRPSMGKKRPFKWIWWKMAKPWFSDTAGPLCSLEMAFKSKLDDSVMFVIAWSDIESATYAIWSIGFKRIGIMLNVCCEVLKDRNAIHWCDRWYISPDRRCVLRVRRMRVKHGGVAMIMVRLIFSLMPNSRFYGRSN